MRILLTICKKKARFCEFYFYLYICLTEQSVRFENNSVEPTSSSSSLEEYISNCVVLSGLNENLEKSIRGTCKI